MLKINRNYIFLYVNIFPIIIYTLKKWFFMYKRMERNLIVLVQNLILKKIIHRISECNNSDYFRFSGLRMSLAIFTVYEYKQFAR